MRRIEYKMPIKKILAGVIVLGFALTQGPWPYAAYLSWGLVYAVCFLGFGLVCIPISELENDIEAQEKREVGHWNKLIVALSQFRTAHPEQFESGLALQKLNRYFWLEFQQSRRYLLRTYAINDPTLETKIEACNQEARDWFLRIESKLEKKVLDVTEADQKAFESIKAFQSGTI